MSDGEEEDDDDDGEGDGDDESGGGGSGRAARKRVRIGKDSDDVAPANQPDVIDVNATEWEKKMTVGYSCVLL